MGNAKLIKYNSFINKFYAPQIVHLAQVLFHLNLIERTYFHEILTNYDKILNQVSLMMGEGSLNKSLNYKIRVSKDMKKQCDNDWMVSCAILDEKCSNHNRYNIHNLSPINRKFVIAILSSNRKRKTKLDIIHTCCRIGEFFYLTDDEMELLGSDIDSFIQAGDCCLFANDGPYKNIPLSENITKDIREKEESVKEYCKMNNIQEANIPNSDQIVDALDRVANDLMRANIEDLPEGYRGLAQICRKINKAFQNSDESDFSDGIASEDMMTKLSGFCLNKEKWFRNLCSENNLPSWKNPEGSILYGGKNYPFSKNYHKHMLPIPDWDMNKIYYSIGKGVWFKIRYVGQPPAHFQNLAEYAASRVKNVIRKHQEKFHRQEEELKENPELDLKHKLYDGSVVNIYNNYTELLDMVQNMTDGYAQDFTAYSDYLNRNIFDWIMRRLFGIPKWYRKIIMHLMSVPVRINGKDYHYLHGSVMGIKFNFLLITFANAIMWMVSNYITGKHDQAKFMGDDFLSVLKKGLYDRRDEEVRFSVCAYFNCVINRSKTETLSESGFVSFCKRYFDRDGSQITGIGGEFLLKQKPFLNDISTLLSVMHQNDIPISEKQRDEIIQSNSELMTVAYLKFRKKEDPDIGDMVNILMKIPYYYGGWSLQDPDDDLEKILLQSILNIVSQMYEEHDQEIESDARRRVREFISQELTRNNMPIENKYYEVMKGISQYSQDEERIQRYVNDIMEVLDNPILSLDKLRRGRSSAQSLLEIVLHRDSRLKSNVSTKDRLDFDRDNDRVSKIRYRYFLTSLEETKHNLKATVIDNLVLKDQLKSNNVKEAVHNYIEYLHLKNKSSCLLRKYEDATRASYIAMQVPRHNPDGEVILLRKRLESNDSSYEHAYRDQNGYWKGLFLNEEDLTSDEKTIYRFLSTKRVRKNIEAIEESYDKATAYALNFLTHRLEELYLIAYGKD